LRSARPVRRDNASLKPRTAFWGAGDVAFGRFGWGWRSVRRGVSLTCFLVFIWWLSVLVFSPPSFIFPGPERVAVSLWQQRSMLWTNAGITLAEILLGLLIGTLLGVVTALVANASPFARRNIMPIVSASQALPVFAIAPMLILWFGLGMGSKVAMATIIIYFPVASAFSDGLQRTEREFVDLARLYGATRLQTLWKVRLPAALPAFASGLRVATTVAPIGAIVGEWVGASGGLGYVINQANARMQTDTVFAGLVVLIVMVLLLRLIVDTALDRLIFWVPSTDRTAF